MTYIVGNNLIEFSEKKRKIMLPNIELQLVSVMEEGVSIIVVYNQ